MEQRDQARTPVRSRSKPAFTARATVAALLLAAGLTPVRADDADGKATVAADPANATRAGHKAVEQGLEFLRDDAAEWRDAHKCATCHHGTMTVWALCEARGRGYKVDDAAFRDVVSWTKERLATIDKPRDPRPGWNMVSTPAVYLALMGLTVPGQDAVSPDELERIAGHLLRHQEADGSWSWSAAPAKNRPPPVMESDEVLTLLASMDLGPHAAAGTAQASAARDGHARAAAWLEKQTPAASTQATALRLFRDVRAGKSAADLDHGVKALLALQRDDGGWGQERGLKSDGYATGQALYFLSLAGIPRDRPETERGVRFLTATQKDDGSWPMTSRAHPGAKPMTNPVPVTYFGSAWATLGLLRSLPNVRTP